MTRTPERQSLTPTASEPAPSRVHVPRMPRPRWLTDDVMRGVRWGAILMWVVVFGGWVYQNGIPYWRSDLLLWLAAGLLAASLGKRNILTVLIDFVPFAAVLVAYDHLRGIADTLGMPTWWHPQIDIDKFLFFGTEPTVWLQEHLRDSTPRWYDAPVALCYISFFFLPYVTAAVLWLRGRAQFYRWSLRFVTLSFLAFGFFALIPAAPPWAAARCSAADVADHPSAPSCMSSIGRFDGGLLGLMHHPMPGTSPWVQAGVSTRGLGMLHLHFAQQVIDEGRNVSDAVAAIPSLHVGGVVLFSAFMWSRVRKWVRPLLVLYPLFMMFSLAYGGEHYVTDGIAGAICALAVHNGYNWLERRRDQWGERRSEQRRQSRIPAADTLDRCPPTSPPPAMTPSSTSASDGDSSFRPATSTVVPARPGITDPSA